MSMPLHPTWEDIALRIVLTLIAGAVIGFNRGVRGHAAGLRTTMLVGLAAALSMIQANLLLATGGKAADSFGVMDVMRLPLGILTGVGFIGAGTILRRGDLLTGVTTAATLWMTTMIGLCLGGGQLGVGSVATVLVVGTLWALEWLDLRLPREQRALLVVRADLGLSVSLESELAKLLGPLGYRARFVKQSRIDDTGQAYFSFGVSWRRSEVADPPLDLLPAVNDRYPVMSFELTSETHH
jgi:putative Mg2+ transporter-C (MgtC) family protein